MPLQGAYLSACSILERLACLRSGGKGATAEGKELSITDKIKDLANYTSLLRAAEVEHGQEELRLPEIIRADGRKAPGSTTFDFQKLLVRWYEIRSNLLHQGKSSFRDYEILWSPTKDMIRVLSRFVASKE